MTERAAISVATSAVTSVTPTRPAMVTAPAQLPAALSPLSHEFPDIHDTLVAALGRAMGTDGVIQFTVSSLAKDADVRLRLVKDYLRAARNDGVLHLLGRRTDDGKIRYCAYETVTATTGRRP